MKIRLLGISGDVAGVPTKRGVMQRRVIILASAVGAVGRVGKPAALTVLYH